MFTSIYVYIYIYIYIYMYIYIYPWVLLFSFSIVFEELKFGNKICIDSNIFNRMVQLIITHVAHTRWPLSYRSDIITIECWQEILYNEIVQLLFTVSEFWPNLKVNFENVNFACYQPSKFIKRIIRKESNVCSRMP